MAADLPNRVFSGDLDLGADLREKLALSSDESLNVLHAAGRLVVLERRGGGDASPIPWDRELVLSADIQSFPMADVLSWLHSAGKSGFLHVSSGEQEKAVYLRRGEVVFATSNQTGDRLGECMLRGNLLSLDQLEQTARRWSRTELFGKALVEQGILTPRQLWHAVKYQVEEIVRSLFSLTSGSLHFWDGEVEPDNAVRLSLPTQHLIGEGLERRDALLRFLAQLEDSDLRIVRTEGSGIGLSGNTRSILDSLDETDSLSGLCHATGFDPLSVARALQLLKIVGAVRFERDSEAGEWLVQGSASSAEDEGVRALVVDHMRLLAELIAPMVAIEGAGPVRERVVQLVEDVSEGQRDLFDALAIGPNALPELEDLVSRALRLTGQREAQVSTGLGELITYVEFELKNHPQIEEAERYLSAVEPLRLRIGR